MFPENATQLPCYGRELVAEVAYLLLVETDYAMLEDVEISNEEDFKNYRSDLRSIMSSGTDQHVFYVPPEPAWV